MSGDQDYRAWHGLDVVDRSGERIGKLEEVFLDDETDEPRWAAVNTGLLGGRPSLAPLERATVADGRVSVAADKRSVKDAPDVDTARGISPEKEGELERHYGIGGAGRDDERAAEAGLSSERGGEHSSERHEHSDERGEHSSERDEQPARVRRHVVTEQLAEDGEVLKRETHTEEERPGPDRPAH